MKITEQEVLSLQDVTGNGALILKHIHNTICEQIDEKTLLDITRLGESLQTIAFNVLKTHKPLSFGRKT